MTQQNLPDEDYVLRHVSYSRTLRDPDTDEVIGCLPDAFKMREIDDGLSVTWIEYFGGENSTIPQINQAVHATRRSLTVGKRSIFAVVNVEKIKSICLSFGNKVRVIHDPEEENKGHSLVKRMLEDDLQLLGMLATEGCAGILLNSDVPEEQ